MASKKKLHLPTKLLHRQASNKGTLTFLLLAKHVAIPLLLDSTPRLKVLSSKGRREPIIFLMPLFTLRAETETSNLREFFPLPYSGPVPAQAGPIQAR